MFNFFDEIKNKVGSMKEDVFDNFDIVNLSGKVVYVEGHMGLVQLSKEKIVFKVKKGQISVEGRELKIPEISENTLYICGQIDRVERV